MNDQNNLPAQHEPKPPVKVEAKRIVEDDGPLAFLLDTARFEHFHAVFNFHMLDDFIMHNDVKTTIRHELHLLKFLIPVDEIEFTDERKPLVV